MQMSTRTYLDLLHEEDLIELVRYYAPKAQAKDMPMPHGRGRESAHAFKQRLRDWLIRVEPTQALIARALEDVHTWKPMTPHQIAGVCTAAERVSPNLVAERLRLLKQQLEEDEYDTASFELRKVTWALALVAPQSRAIVVQHSSPYAHTPTLKF